MTRDLLPNSFIFLHKNGFKIQIQSSAQKQLAIGRESCLQDSKRSAEDATSSLISKGYRKLIELLQNKKFIQDIGADLIIRNHLFFYSINTAIRRTL